MSTEMNGTDCLVLVETVPGNGVFLVVASQTGVQFDQKTAPIDMSSKESRNYKGKPGRYNATVKMSALYVPTSSGYTSLRTAMRTGVTVQIKRQELGSVVETADAIVTDLGSDFPDQGAAKLSASFQITGAWA